MWRIFAVLGIFAALWVAFRGFKKPKARNFQAPRFDNLREKVVDKGELKQDPVSGKYISEKDAIKVVKNGQTYYFENQENADVYRK